MAASSWLWQGELLTLGCWLPGPSRFPSNARPGHWEGENVRALPCQQLLTTLTSLLWLWHPGLQPGAGGADPAEPASSFSPPLPASASGLACLKHTMAPDVYRAAVQATKGGGDFRERPGQATIADLGNRALDDQAGLAAPFPHCPVS